MGFDLGNFLSDAVKTVGKVASDVGNAVVKAGGDILKGVGNVVAAPFKVVDDLIHGKRIDEAFVDSFKQALSGIQEIAPYAQAVISFVPGIGPIASAAIGGALAIAEGKPIDEVLMSAVAGAIPGGPFVKAAFDIGKAALQHKPIEQVVMQGIGDLGSQIGVIIPDNVKEIMQQGLSFAQQTANGLNIDPAAIENVISKIPDPIKQNAIRAAMHPDSKKGVADVLLETAQDMLPVSPDVKKQIGHALTIGMSMGHAQTLQGLQKKVVTSPKVQATMAKKAATLTQDPVIGAARQSLGGQGTHGFDQGTALVHTMGTTRHYLYAARQSMASSPHDVRGFDTALALHIGRVNGPKANPQLSYTARAAHAISHGLKKAPAGVKVPIVKVLQANPAAAPGLAQANAEIESIMGNKPFLFTTAGFLLGVLTGNPVVSVIGAGIGYFLSSGGLFEPHPSHTSPERKKAQ